MREAAVVAKGPSVSEYSWFINIVYRLIIFLISQDECQRNELASQQKTKSSQV